MRVLIALGLTVIGIFTFSGTDTKAISQQREPDASYKEGLKISLDGPKRRFKRNDKIKLQVLLTNVSYKSLYVLGSLEWGYNASLLLHVRDASGKEIEPSAFPDSQIFVDPNDEGEFLKLRPNHFVGTNFVSDPKFLNISRPGKYSIYVEYFSKVPSSSVTVKPFWGRENGTIFSNLVWIEVLP